MPQPTPPAAGRSWLRPVFRLRVEELLALAFLLPCAYLTVVADRYAARMGLLGARLPGGVPRLAIAVAFLLLLVVLAHYRPRRPWLAVLRELLPFLACILIYTNLHDTIGFVNPHDVDGQLAALDAALFGVQPSVWAERFVSRELTELMSFFYLNFFWIAPSTSVLLLLQGRWREFRATTLALVLCFYAGYLLYVIFPAAPPRLTLAHEYARSLEGYPRLFSSLEAGALRLLPEDSRAAFPSLHTAATLVALVCAFRHARRLFFVLLPLVLGLWVSTIYLRHHYFVDLLAGWLLAPLALLAAPRIDAWWAERQRANGFLTALGAPAPDARDGSPAPEQTPPAAVRSQAGS